MGNWVYKYALKIKRQFLSQFFKIDTPDVIQGYQKRLNALQHALKMDETGVMWLIFDLGIEAAESKVIKDKKAPERDDPTYQEWAIALKMSEIKKRQEHHASLKVLYTNMPTTEFVTYCEESGIQYKDFLGAHTMVIPQAERDKDWLRNHLEQNGPERRADIKDAAFAEGYVTDETEWARLEGAARRMNLHENTPERGYWSWNKLDDI